MGVTEKYANLPPLPKDITDRLMQVPMVLQRHPIRLAYLFGSAVRDITHCTDIDIAVLPDEGFSYMALYADLSLALNTDRLDLVDLRFAPSYLQAEIVTGGKCLLAYSERGRLRFEQGVRMRWREERRRWLNQKALVAQGAKAMGLHKEFIIQALSKLERIAQELEKYQSTAAQAIATNLSLRWTIERGLLAGLTVLFQIADHILATHFQRAAGTYEGLLAELHASGVISKGLYSQLRGAGGFRNVLVHEYLDIDLNEVVNTLRKSPSVFRAFAQEISTWVHTLPEGG